MSSLTGISQPPILEISTPVHGPRLVGLSRKIGIGFWAIIWLFSLVSFFLAIYVWYLWDRTPAGEILRYFPDAQGAIQSHQNYQNAITQLGLNLPLYAGLFVVLRLLSGAPYFILSYLILKRRSDRLMAVLFAMFLPVGGAAGRWIQANWLVVPGRYPWMHIPVTLLTFILDCSVILFYAFPDGRFVPRWTRWFAAAAILVNILRDFTGNSSLNPDKLPGVLATLPVRILILVGLFAMVHRYLHNTNAVQKQQIKWVLAGSLLLILVYFVHFFLFDFYYSLTGKTLIQTPMQSLISELILEPAWYVGQFIFVICIGISVFRYRLWDIDLILNRVLVYGALTLLTMGIYLSAVASLGSFFRGLADPVISFLAAGLVAALFEPIRRHMQRLVNRLMYGERDDPYYVLTRLSKALETTSSTDDILPSVAKTIGQALKIPYVAIQLDHYGEERLVVVNGNPSDDLLTFPLIYQGERVGSLQLARRARGEEFSSGDLGLIENIAHQAGAAAQAVRLNAELLRSRTQIVTEREEERRRIRRDLHDELGPMLASQSLKMAAIRHLIQIQPGKAEGMVDDVIRQNEQTIVEIRRLVHGLRPPALDELGLVEAIRDTLRHSEGEEIGSPGMAVEISGPPDGLPALPAAVEANAYRIVLEALANAARHAQAARCSVKFQVEAEELHPATLVIQIRDDGKGFPQNYQAGVGLRSMRERAEEIGGHISIEAGQPRGTQVTAWLPLSV